VIPTTSHWGIQVRELWALVWGNGPLPGLGGSILVASRTVHGFNATETSILWSTDVVSPLP
jgi:hypothetical protein